MKNGMVAIRPCGCWFFHYKMYRQGETLQIAFDKAVKSISESLGADVLMGNPS